LGQQPLFALETSLLRTIAEKYEDDCLRMPFVASSVVVCALFAPLVVLAFVSIKKRLFLKEFSLHSASGLVQ
jgi:hypothetical protein